MNMFRCALMKISGAALLIATMATVGVTRAEANAVEDAAKLLIICKMTGTCPGVQQRDRRRDDNRGGVRHGGLSPQQKEQNREVQHALNAFNFPVGGVDGVLGEKSRAAISSYQYYMNWPATGKLDSFQRETLVDTWRKLQYGGASAYPRMLAAEGNRGFLRAALNPDYLNKYGDLTAGRPPINPPIQPDQGGQEIVGDDNSDDDGWIIPDATPSPSKVASITAHCDLVQLTSTAKGLSNSTNMTDPEQALNEKFCGAREFAMRNGQFERDGIEITDAQLDKICGVIESQMKTPMQRLVIEGRRDVLAQAAAVNGSIGLTNASKALLYGQICLGMGYRQDNAEMALASALVLTAAGQSPFSELVGHHLRVGVGVAKNSGASSPWYEGAVTALEEGQTPVFEPSSTRERIMVIRKAIEMGGLRAGPVETPEFTLTGNEIANPKN